MITYKDAGVDVEKADKMINSIRGSIESTFDSNVISDIGSFAGHYNYNGINFLAATDGVGTKLKIAFDLGIHHTVGIDLVAMSVNDIIADFGKPLFFLDYFSCGKLNERVYEEVMQGIIAGCRLAKCSLIGGETAEMPDMYNEGEYDLAGFCVGIKEYADDEVMSGDIIVGVKSSGLHSNGFSLVRKVIGSREDLLEPTRIYRDIPVSKERAHITGGGIAGNLSRVVNNAVIYKNSWPVSDIFYEVAEKSKLTDDEMLKTFNCGIGFVYVVDRVQALPDDHFVIGEVTSSKGIKFIGNNIF